MDRSLAPNLRVWFPPPGFFIADARLAVLVDGFGIYDGSFKTGCDVLVPVAPGPHTVSTRVFFGPIARSKDYALVVAPGRGCSVQLVYSRFWGNFASAPKVTHHGA